MKLLNGTTAAVDFSVQPYTLAAVGTNGVASGTTSGSATSVKCHYGSLEINFEREVAGRQVVFCSSNWAVPVPGICNGSGNLAGFVASGDTYSDPTSLIDPASTPYFQIVATFDTGCTVTVPAFFTRDNNAIQAFGMGSRQTSFAIVGKPTIGWVVG